MALTPAEGSVERMVSGCTKSPIQHSQNDVDRHQCRQDQPGLSRQCFLDACALPLNVPLIVAGAPTSASACLINSTASPSAMPEAMPNEIVADGNMPS